MNLIKSQITGQRGRRKNGHSTLLFNFTELYTQNRNHTKSQYVFHARRAKCIFGIQ